jgi:hypothetical protein
VLQGLVIVGIALFVAGYLGAKLLALVVLSSTSFPAAVGWCFTEALVLLMARFFAEGKRWRLHIAGLSGAVPSLLVHVFFYIGMLAAPFPVLR